MRTTVTKAILWEVADLNSRCIVAMSTTEDAFDPGFLTRCWADIEDDEQRVKKGPSTTNRLALQCFIMACSSACMCVNVLPVRP